jgi:hypothetical protein
MLHHTQLVSKIPMYWLWSILFIHL